MDAIDEIRLNKKEIEILLLLSEGCTNEVIAEKMILSVPTIKWYRKKLKEKFAVETTVQVVAKAIRAGII